MTCPFCRAEIPDDSWFCDQCGKELHFCPDCRKPKRGTECAACGASLVCAEDFFAPPQEEVISSDDTPFGKISRPSGPVGGGFSESSDIFDKMAKDLSSDIAAWSGGSQPAKDAPTAEPEGTAVSQARVPQAPAFSIVGEGLRLRVREGVFGRRGGLYPELSAFPYISGTHARFDIYEGEWVISDLGSTNGTFLYGKRLEPNQMYYLERGAALRLATYEFSVE